MMRTMTLNVIQMIPLISSPIKEESIHLRNFSHQGFHYNVNSAGFCSGNRDCIYVV